MFLLLINGKKEIIFLDLLFELVNKFYDLMIFLELRDKYLIDLWKEEFYKFYEKIVKLEMCLFGL